MSFLEAVFARGDRRLGASLVKAWEKGAKFDSWTEHFRFSIWKEAFQETCFDPAAVANARRDYDEVLPWDHIEMGVTKEFLQEEREKAYRLATTGDCRFENCTLCGVCQGLSVETVLAGEARRTNAAASKI